jgi:hypothetical protein
MSHACVQYKGTHITTIRWCLVTILYTKMKIVILFLKRKISCNAHPVSHLPGWLHSQHLPVPLPNNWMPIPSAPAARPVLTSTSTPHTSQLSTLQFVPFIMQRAFKLTCLMPSGSTEFNWFWEKLQINDQMLSVNNLKHLFGTKRSNRIEKWISSIA